jgi:CRISPR/Cas system type I-B associated protein Csh2 (Cas7 group RAMP superfamily)
MTQINRGTGFSIIEVRHSNPNGDPDTESDPRILDPDGRGLISPVSFKRKLRDLVDRKEGDLWSEAAKVLGLPNNGGGTRGYKILETRGRRRNEIWEMSDIEFQKAFWDARGFGNTFLESMKDKTANGDEVETKKTKKKTNGESPRKDHFISTGVVQFGPGISIAPIEVERLTMTNKAGVEEDKDRGMAPLGWRVVRHAVYAMPFFVNPMAAGKTGCDPIDIELLKFLIPHAYRNTASAIRPFVEMLHAWYAEHKGPLGSCPDSQIIDPLTPRKLTDGNEASRSIDEYEIPTTLPEAIQRRLKSIEDLCNKSWS